MLQFAWDDKFALAAFNILVPYPGTPLYQRLRAEGRLLYDGKWWLHPEYRFNYATFRPKNMSPEELTEACWHAGLPIIASARLSVGRLILRPICSPCTNWV